MILMILPGGCSILLTTETKVTKSDVHHVLENIIEIVNTYYLQVVPCDVRRTLYNFALLRGDQIHPLSVRNSSGIEDE